MMEMDAEICDIQLLPHEFHTIQGGKQQRVVVDVLYILLSLSLSRALVVVC